MVIYKKYGEVFRKIRIQESFPLSFFASVGISKSNLSDFETGKKMMSFDKVVIALQAMNFSLREFEDYLNDYSNCDIIDILYKIEDSYLLKDTDKLQELYGVLKINNLPYIALYIKILLNTATLDDLETLINFLHSIDAWGYKELSIFYITMSRMSPKEVITVLSSIKQNSPGIYYSKEYNRLLTLVLCQACLLLSQQHYRQQSKKILDIIIQYELATTMFLKTILLGTKGVWTFHFDNMSKGINMIKDSLHIHELAGFPFVYAYYKKKYNQYIIL